MKDNKHTIGSGLDDEWAASHGLRTGSMLNDLIIDQKKRVRNNSEVTLVGEKGLKFFADLISLVGAFAAAYAVIRIYEYQIEWYWPVAAFFLAGTI
ncbi:MAG: hypothetical protein KDI27_14690, partial [Gammaproteobacteria bacterium]|nr:hypothetical protein [Gammaproteobacteria bacterium]